MNEGGAPVTAAAKGPMIGTGQVGVAVFLVLPCTEGNAPGEILNVGLNIVSLEVLMYNRLGLLKKMRKGKYDQNPKKKQKVDLIQEMLKKRGALFDCSTFVENALTPSVIPPSDVPSFEVSRFDVSFEIADLATLQISACSYELEKE